YANCLQRTKVKSHVSSLSQWRAT
ncbi:aminotransferase class-III family protein, partial [Vibrio parahaemolyticus V-223/04]